MESFLLFLLFLLIFIVGFVFGGGWYSRKIGEGVEKGRISYLDEVYRVTKIE